MAAVPPFDPKRLEALQINTPMMAQANAVKVCSHFDCSACPTDDSQMLLANIKAKDLKRYNAMAFVAHVANWDGMRYLLMSELALTSSVGGKGKAAVVEISRTPNLVGGSDVGQGRVERLRNFLAEKL